MDWLDAVRRSVRHGAPQFLAKRSSATTAMCACALSLLLFSVSLAGLLPAPQAQAAASWGLPPDASCAALAGLDRSATNGSQWGQTIFPGNNVRGGWFGVDVCGNGVNASAPNGANVSCDRMPSNWPKTGCAPGNATSDGYGLTFQCVELVIRFSSWAFGDSVSAWGRSGWGNAPDLWLAANHPSDWVMYPNGSNHAPVAGDILVWGEVDAHGQPWPAGPGGEHDGHIGMVAAVHNGVVITAEQNVKWGSADHPSDTLALTKVGGRWILSGSNRPETMLPTYRWRSTMGTTRATFGWLHNVNNTGVFPAKGVQNTTKAPKPAATPTTTSTAKQSQQSQQPQQSGGLPSLDDSAVITADGMLTDLSWSTTDLFSTSTTNQQSPSAHVRSLGAPPGTHLVANQAVSVVELPDGTRYCYAVGSDGHLYSARTTPDVIGVLWTDLGAPDNAQLQPGTSASTYAGGVGVTALGSDGNLWWRAGPAASPGGWLLVGRPTSSPLAGSFALAGQPGSGSPLMLALGQDGRIYERIWQQALSSGDGSVQVPAGWSDWLTLHAQLPAVHLIGKLLLVPETVNAQSWEGAWPDTPIDLLGTDALGNLWWLRSVSATSGWKLSPVHAPHAVTSLLAAVAVAHANSKPPQTTSALHAYVATVAGPYFVSLDVPTDAPAASNSQPSAGNKSGPTWTPLAPLPQGMTAASTGAAVALSADASVLVVSKGDGLLAGGASAATSVLLATDSLSITTPSGASNSWQDVGSVSGAAAFADPLTATALDGRWYLAGTGAAASPSTHGVRLAARSAGAAALFQSASPGDGAVQVQVTVPQSGGSAAEGGLVLYLDGSDWLTVTVNGAGRLSLCATARQTTAPCQTASLKQLPASRSLWLRITRASGYYTGAYSTDGQNWQTLGSWSAPVVSASASAGGTGAQSTASVTPGTPSPAPAATRTATPASTAASTATPQQGTGQGLASLAFTQWGLYVQGGATATSWPSFQNFTVSSATAGR